MRKKARAFECLAKGKIIAHGHHYFQLSKHSKNTAFTSQGFSEGFFFTSARGKKNHLIQKSMKTGGEEGRGVWGFTDVLARLAGIHAAPPANESPPIGRDGYGAGQGQDVSLGKKKGERGLGVSSPRYLH